ncbi:MAG TPA: S-adenosylmethionine:tRNA ribosyltransferase-isomerase [Chloroflexota bacterium]|nr:S-adenosylmethionine:tRNA ribosyltransferase-isomerase [Chloroflexota bacterium]
MASTVTAPRLDFELPAALEAHEPPEARGLARDEVRLMVSRKRDGRLQHARFRDLPSLLAPGTLLVLNRSATLPAEVAGFRSDGAPVVIHFSTRLPKAVEQLWTLELRTPAGARVRNGRIGELLFLPEGGTARVLDAYPPPDELVIEGSRLWTARLHLPRPVLEYLAANGKPIRYAHIAREWPLSAYLTEFADRPGSAEMPSAGRPLTRELLVELRRRGVETAFITLHTGVSSQEADELPFPEYFEVPPETAAAVQQARAAGRPVIAVGTTVVRALESAADSAAHGWTDVVITPERGVRFVDGLITGWHEPRASHLLMLEAIAGRPLLEASYTEAIRAGYLWHEFGDSQLILP